MEVIQCRLLSYQFPVTSMLDDVVVFFWVSFSFHLLVERVEAIYLKLVLLA